MDMEMVAGIQAGQAAQTGTKIAYAVADKVMDTTNQLQQEMVQKLLGGMGVGNNLNIVA